MNIIVAGDYCPRYRIAEMLLNSDYSYFDEISDIIRSADYSIVNLECPICESDISPIVKCGPALKTNTNVVKSIKYAGFQCATLANNHFRDFGDIGCNNTINELANHRIDYVGGGNTLKEAQRVLYKDIKGERLAIINICENEFSIATETTAGAAPIDLIDNYHQILEAKSNAKYVLMIIHGGHEMYQLPSPRMKKLYRHYVDLGVDAVINHHQHCYSGYEYYKGKPIVYGIGNLCFGSPNEQISKWNEGYLVNILFCKEGVKINLTPYEQDCNKTNARIAVSDDPCFHSKIKELNDIIADDDLLSVNFNKWIASCYKSKLSLFSSYHNRYLNAAASRGYIPRPASRRELVSLLNNIACESHRDISMAVLYNACNKK